MIVLSKKKYESQVIEEAHIRVRKNWGEFFIYPDPPEPHDPHDDFTKYIYHPTPIQRINEFVKKINPNLKAKWGKGKFSVIIYFNYDSL